MNDKTILEISEHLKIQEQALSNLADAIRKRNAESDEEIKDILVDLKALKMFLTRNMPGFKIQFPELRSKVK